MTSLPNRFYHWIRHPSASSLASDERMVSGFEHLRGHKYCLLVSYKRSGEAVPTPVWFGLCDGKLYVRSEAQVAKVRRIRNDPQVRVAPCTVRGKPLGPPAAGEARVLDQPSDEAVAEAALQANYGEVVPWLVELCRWRSSRLVRLRWELDECDQVTRTGVPP